MSWNAMEIAALSGCELPEIPLYPNCNAFRPYKAERYVLGWLIPENVFQCDTTKSIGLL